MEGDLLEKTKQVYLKGYHDFKRWKELNKQKSFSVSVLLIYFTYLSTKYKSTSLCTKFSIIKNTISRNENIETYPKLMAFLKSKVDGCHAKQASIFSVDNIKTFLNYAPHDNNLAIKVAVIMSVMGACHLTDLSAMKLCDLEDFGSSLVVHLPHANSTQPQKFIVTKDFYALCHKYISNRSIETDTFVFHHYQNGKVMNQRFGKNGFTKMARDVANFLQLNGPESYSGHSFRKTSASILLDVKANGIDNMEERLAAEVELACALPESNRINLLVFNAVKNISLTLRGNQCSVLELHGLYIQYI